MLKTTVYSSQELPVKVAEEIAQEIRRALQERGVARVVLAGGSTFRSIYQLLAEQAFDWAGIEFFIGDERMVPLTAPESNFLMIQESLRPEFKGAKLHRWMTELTPEEAIQAYQSIFPEASFDVVLLGLGSDGHSASLFPAVLPEIVKSSLQFAFVREAGLPPLLPRLTFTPRSLTHSRKIIIVASGEGKAQVIPQIINDPEKRFPLSYLIEKAVPVELILDNKAAVFLKM